MDIKQWYFDSYKNYYNKLFDYFALRIVYLNQENLRLSIVHNPVTFVLIRP